MAKVFVTGGTGFIGRHLLPRLRRIADVEVLVSPGTRLSEPHVKARTGDLRHQRSLRPARNADVIIHMAALSYVPDLDRDPLGGFDVNATGTLRLLEEARRGGEITRFVFVSSGQVYGRAQYTPIDEAHPVRPANLYAAGKAAAEALVRAYGETYGVPAVILRAFNVYGPHQAGRFLVPSIIKQLREGKAPRLGNLRPVRDFTYVDDFVDALYRASFRRGAAGETFNVGTGRGHSIREVALTLMGIAGVPGRPKSETSKLRKGDSPRLVVDNRKIRAHLGWQPKVSLRHGLARTWEGFRLWRTNSIASRFSGMCTRMRRRLRTMRSKGRW